MSYIFLSGQFLPHSQKNGWWWCREHYPLIVFQKPNSNAEANVTINVTQTGKRIFEYDDKHLLLPKM